MRTLITIIALLLALSTSVAHAQSPAQVLGTCLTDNTTGRDRKDLARWIFTAMAAHPDIESMSGVTTSEREEASRVAGALFTRLFVENCTEEVRTAMEVGDDSVIGAGFGILGEVAMQELMRNEEVEVTMENLVNHIDLERLEEVFQQE